MLQRIMIGIAMALKPALLIADEPTTAIDSITQYEILEEFVRIKKEHDTARSYHDDLARSRKVADQLVVMNHGEIADRGSFSHIPASCLRSVYETSPRKTVSCHAKKYRESIGHENGGAL